MSKMKPEKSRIKSDILLRVRLLYILFILAGLLIFARLVWVQLFSSEVAYNAERLAGRIFTEQIIPAQRGNILTRDGDPLATSIFRYRVEFDFGSPGLDSVRTFHEQSDSLSKLLAAYFGDRSAAEYRRMFRTQHAKHYQVKYRKDTLVPRSEGRIARWIDRILDREFVPKKLYDTLRDHTPVQIFPRDIDYTEWETLRKYPLLNWNMGMVYNLRESDERIYPQGELGRRTIGLTGDRGNYGIEAVYREELAGRDGRATRQRIARGFYGRVVDGDNIDPIDGLDVVTTLDLDVQDVANRYLREQLEAQNAIWGTTIVMEVRTGEILALVNLGRTPGGGYAERENYAIGRNTEPGSTFKLASMLLLLDDADMPLDQTYDTGNGRVVKVGGIPGAGFARRIQRHGFPHGGRPVVERLFRQGDLGALCRQQGALQRLHEKAAPRPNRRTGGFRREKTALSGLEGGARPQQYARTPLVRLSYQTLPDPGHHPLQRHCQRRQDDLADSGPGAASGRGRGQALQNPDSRG